MEAPNGLPCGGEGGLHTPGAPAAVGIMPSANPVAQAE